MMEPGAAPAAAARNCGTGGPRDPIGRHYDRPAGSLLDWDWPQGLVPGNAEPGAGNRRSGAPRGVASLAREATRLAMRVGRLRQPPGGLRQAPAFLGAPLPLGSVEWDDGVPGAAKNTGGAALAN